MQNATYTKDRYPGLRSFGKDQSSLFFGREGETTELFNLVSLEKIVVLFGKSGLGKSSLLNAGLSPLLEQNGYQPVRVRFSPGNRLTEKDLQENTNFLLKDFIISFDGFNNSGSILYDSKSPQLWEYIKSTKFTGQDGEPLMPVFIFDQFEEFFYHPLQHQQEFLKQLAEVVHEQPPRRILEWVTGIEAAKRTPEQLLWHQQPVVKIIFALRSDKLSLMQSVTAYIKTILRYRYELKPLTRQQALNAIEQPAIKDMGEGYTPAFSFNKKTLAGIVNELGKGSDEIESSQLQMVCNYIEQRVRIEQDREEGIQQIEVNEMLIVPEWDILRIRNNFYEDQLNKLDNDADKTLVKRVLEDELVIEGQRASLLETQLITELGGRKDLIDVLLKVRLIREENTNRGITYEVSHDTLVEPIERAKEKRLEAEEKIKAETERKKMAEEAAKRNEELRENLKRLANEMQLREEAQAQRAEAEKQRKRAKFYSIISLVLLLLVLAAALFIYSKQREESTELVNKLKTKSDTLQQVSDKLQIEKEKYQDVVLKNINTQLPESHNIANPTEKPVINDTALSYFKDVINDMKATDTADSRYKEVINKVYETQVKRGANDTAIKQYRNISTKEKVEYLRKELPDIPLEKRKPYRFNKGY